MTLGFRDYTFPIIVGVKENLKLDGHPSGFIDNKPEALTYCAQPEINTGKLPGFWLLVWSLPYIGFHCLNHQGVSEGLSGSAIMIDRIKSLEIYRILLFMKYF